LSFQLFLIDHHSQVVMYHRFEATGTSVLLVFCAQLVAYFLGKQTRLYTWEGPNNRILQWVFVRRGRSSRRGYRTIIGGLGYNVGGVIRAHRDTLIYPGKRTL
jgi:hypothetical protein